MSTEIHHSRFFDNPAFRGYVRLLYQLHLLIENDADESDEGERIRDEMDVQCEDLIEEEIQAVNGISADLYTLSDPQKEFVRNPTAELRQAMAEISDLKESGEFCRAFQRIRENETFLDPARTAFLRGSIWRDAGEFEIASRFLELAAREKHPS